MNAQRRRALSVSLALTVLVVTLASAGAAMAVSSFTMDTFPNHPGLPGIAVNEGDSVVLNWQGSELAPNTAWIRYYPYGPSGGSIQSIATNLPTTGSYTMTIPSGFAPSSNAWVAMGATRDAANGGGTIYVNSGSGAGYLTVGAATGGTPPPITDGVTGASAFSYQDLQDVSAKREGGYAAFSNTEFAGDYDDPHGGYDTTTNKCKVCHAVHRAEGAYYLLRADSQDDACDYCHIGGSAHSSKVVYDFGKYTTNGHTIGASTAIPDSTIDQWAETVTLASVDANMLPISEDIEVRAYDATKASMYRFTRHHGHGAWGSGRSGYGKVGPLALRCMNCHQTHNATAQIWRPLDFDGSNEFDSAGTRSGYKLLKAFPSGSTEGSANVYGNYEPGQVIAVPESTLTAGVNYSQVQSAEATSTDPFFPAGAYKQPVWIAQHIGPEAGHEHGADRDANAVNTMALSVWCADCHNLNIGGFEVLTNVELGFKAHTERTHPAPYSGAYNGPGQCYSCHRADLSPVPAAPAYAGGFRTGCEQCHYGTASYYSEVTTGTGTDFPHSADPAQSIKLLGGYSVVPTAPTTIDDTVNITENNLDAVCLRCHGGIGTNH